VKKKEGEGKPEVIDCMV